HHRSRGRIADSRPAPAREFRVAEAPHLVALEAASGPQECGHEAQLLRLERRLHAGSPDWSNHLVCAGPGSNTNPTRPRGIRGFPLAGASGESAEACGTSLPG